MGLCADDPSDGSKEMRQQEEERQARIREGTNRINRVFGGDITTMEPIFEDRPSFNVNAAPAQWKPNTAAPITSRTMSVKTGERPIMSQVPGQFTDDFYHTLENNYNDYYNPQLQRQESDAERNLKINLARSGNLTGSVGARQIGRLAEDKATQERALSDNALKYSNDARTKTEGTRANLIGQLESGAGIENVANQASAAAKTATAPAAFSPLGDLFKNYSAAVANSSIAAGNPTAFPGAQQYRNSLLFNAGGNNSATVVN